MDTLDMNAILGSPEEGSEIVDEVVQDVELEEEIEGFEDTDGFAEDPQNQGLSKEEQSAKDKAWAEVERLRRELDEFKAKSSQAPPPVQPMEPIVDQVQLELQPYAQELQRLVDGGDISESAAELFYRDAYSRAKTIHDLQRNITSIASTFTNTQAKELYSSFESTLRAEGVTDANMAEAKRLLREDWKVDPDNPLALTQLGADNVQKMAGYVAAKIVRSQPKKSTIPTVPMSTPSNRVKPSVKPSERFDTPNDVRKYVLGN